MSSDPQLDLALSELDDIYNELKDLKNETTSPKKGEYPSYSTPRNYGSKKEPFSDRAQHSSIRQHKSTQRVSFNKHRPMDPPTRQSPTVTSYPEEWRPDSSYDNQQLTSGGDFPAPPADTPPPVDEYVMRSTLGHCDSDYDEVPDEDDGYAPGSMADNEEIPDYDEIPESDPVALGYEEAPNPYVSMGTLPYPTPRHSLRGEQPFPTYSFVEKKRKETEHDTSDHMTSANNQSSFYDNWRGEDKVDSGMAGAAVVSTTETLIYPELKESPHQNGNGFVHQKSIVTSQHVNDDEWDEESIPGVEINGKDSAKTTTVVTVTPQTATNNNNEEDFIDCTQKKPKHQDGERLCCRLLMSIAIVIMVAFLLAALIMYIYFGVDLSGRHPGLGATIATANNGTSGR